MFWQNGLQGHQRHVMRLLFFVVMCSIHGRISSRQGRPNIILIVADDMGYGDLASYGHPTQEWNILDQLASEGVRFTQFYSPATFCTPSRAALLTGRLPIRLGMYGDLPVFLPSHSTGLPKSEITLAEILRDSGYNTGIVGKWHLGINEFNSTDGNHLPDKHGFNYVGVNLPFSLETVCDETKRHRRWPRACRCFLYRQQEIVQQPLDMTNLTAAFIEDIRTFLYNHNTTHHDQPFFLYLPLLQPHTPMFNDPKFKGTSARGEYGDQIAELAWAVEETLETVRHLGAESNTMVVFVSDHGPHREMCSEGGSTGPFRGGKGNFYEGGIRIPAFFWWPGQIPSQQANPTVASLTDLFATLTDFAEIKVPPQLQTDSISLRAILQPNIEEPNVKPVHDILFFYCSSWLTALRYKRYKIHFRSQRIIEESGFSHCTNGISNRDFFMDQQCANHVDLQPPIVYDVEKDPGEWFPMDPDHSRPILQEVEPLVKKHQHSLIIPKHQLFNTEYISNMLIPCCNPPYCICNYNPDR